MSKKLSAEEILNIELQKQNYHHVLALDSSKAAPSVYRSVSGIVLKAMHTFADQEKQIEAKACAEWCLKNYRRTGSKTLYYNYSTKTYHKIDELYLLFKSNNK